MNEVYNISNVMFLTSFNELLPMSILETMQLDMPFLLRDLDLYEPLFNGRYIKGHDVDDFVTLIEKLATDKEFYQAAVDHSRFNKEFYNKASILKKWEEFYTRVYKQK
jgi:1,2-diacylglycerol-3-alpha-glucose alpha-1,2-galactosyltransferase